MAVYVERVGPIIARARSGEAWLRQMEQRRVAAQETMAGAIMQGAIVDQKRLQLQQQMAGMPQVFVPGVGFETYPGGYAMPR